MLPEGEHIIAKQYKYILQKLFIPFYNKIRRKYSNEVVMQEYNAPQHTAKVITKYLANKKVNKMNWPLQSPDLNPIKNLWKYIKDIISKRRHKVRNVKDIRYALTAIQPEIDRNFLLKLSNSVPRRWEACLKNEGGATKY